MFIKSLRIESIDGLIRDMQFHPGLNLIVDETPEHLTETGNNVGKTTVLRLVDICLGKDPKSIYVSPEDKRTVNMQVRQFLVEKQVVVTLTLVNDWSKDSQEVCIRRNFLNYSKAIREINGQQIQDKDFEQALQQSLMGIVTKKPSFRQLIAHNIRYSNLAITQTLRNLDGNTTDPEYEALYLYMLGCDYSNADLRQDTMEKLNTEKSFKNRLEKQKGRNVLASELGIVKSEISELERQKQELSLNPDFEQNMARLTALKFDINTISSQLSSLMLRRSILIEAQQELTSQKSNIDVESLKMIYSQAKMFIPSLHKTFEELLAHHNNMLEKKAEFVGEELPTLDERIKEIELEVESLRQEETNISIMLQSSTSYADYESLISELTKKYERLGSLSQLLEQIKEVDAEIEVLNKTLSKIDEDLFADAFQNKVQEQLDKFNTYFARISNHLYGEQYAMIYEIVHNKKTDRDVYKFSIIPVGADTVNFSTGKKQGEITCFDMAYILFADKEGIPCLHFGLYDKKELMHDHQLEATAQFVGSHVNMQFVASILKDKLPASLNDEKYFVVKLKPEDKLFRF